MTDAAARASATVLVTVQDTVAPGIHAFLFPPIPLADEQARWLSATGGRVDPRCVHGGAAGAAGVDLASNPDPRRTPDDIQGAAIGTDDRLVQAARREQSPRPADLHRGLQRQGRGGQFEDRRMPTPSCRGMMIAIMMIAITDRDHDNDHHDRDRDDHR